MDNLTKVFVIAHTGSAAVNICSYQQKQLQVQGDCVTLSKLRMFSKGTSVSCLPAPPRTFATQG